jgi:glycosyltransferase involved in cell wall biosynthesis
VGAPGCDDAPYVTIARQQAPKSVTLIVPYYENPLTLAWQMLGWNTFPEELRRRLQVIIVDDGSPEHPAENVMQELDVDFKRRLFRIKTDVRWNWLAARNIGAHHAETEWILLTDIDHVVTPECFDAVVYGVHLQHLIYRFSRREHTGEAIHPHPNSWLMTRRMFWKVGGYDEALSGYYGTDGEYRRRCAAAAGIRILTDELVRREHDGDSSTKRYLRKQPEDAAVKKIIRARRPNWRPKTLSFPYCEVSL